MGQSCRIVIHPPSSFARESAILGILTWTHGGRGDRLLYLALGVARVVTVLVCGCTVGVIGSVRATFAPMATTRVSGQTNMQSNPSYICSYPIL